MRAIHVNTSTAWGGLEQYTLYMAKVFRGSGVDVTIMAVPQSNLARAAREAGFPLIDAHKGKHIDPVNIMRLRRALTDDTVVHTHTRIDVWTGSLACMGTRAAHVNSVHMIPADKRDPLHALIYGRVDAIVNTCETHVRNIAVRYPVKPERVHLIRHMRDPHQFVFDASARSRYRAEWGIGDDELVVGYVARIDVLKGTREFAASSDHFHDEDRSRIRLIVIGEPSIGSHRADGTSVPEPAAAEIVQWLEERAREPQHRLVVRPFTTDVAGVMSAFDVFVLATYGEMYALTVLEAMMVGLPVIGTDTDGTPDQLADGRGLLVASRSASAIAEGITTMLHHPERRAAMAAKGHDWAVAEFNPEHVAPQWIELYRNVIQQRQRS